MKKLLNKNYAGQFHVIGSYEINFDENGFADLAMEDQVADTIVSGTRSGFTAVVVEGVDDEVAKGEKALNQNDMIIKIIECDSVEKLVELAGQDTRKKVKKAFDQRMEELTTIED